MVKLQEVEDEHFAEKPTTTKDNALLADDDSDADYTDTDSEISSASESDALPSESLTDRLTALVDIIPPPARARLSATTSRVSSFTKSTFSFTGKALWVVSTSVILLAIPFSLAVAQEQEIEAQERDQRQFGEGASQMLQSGAANAPDGTEAQGGQGGRPTL